MNGIEFIADTNCFIYYLEEHPAFSTFRHDGWAYSYITEIELLSKSTLTAAQDDIVRTMLSSCLRLEHNQPITELAINIRRKYKLKIADTIIAATAQFMTFHYLRSIKIC